MARDIDPFDEEELAIQEIERDYKNTEDQIEQLEVKIKTYQAQAMQAKERGDSETLSNTLVRLARVNSALGSKSAYALYIARNSDRAYRRIRERVKLNKINEKNAIGKAESMAYLDSQVEAAFKLWSSVQLLADTANDMSYRTDTFLKMAQSGLSLIKNDINGRP